MKLVWGNFSFFHIITIVLVFVAIIALYFILKKKGKKTQKYTLFTLSLWGIAAIIYNLTAWNAPLEYLPLHMCSINALFLPIAIISENKFLNNLLPVYSIGALAAIIFNNGIADAEVMSPVFLMYYVPHLFEFAVPILQIMLKRTKMQLKYIFPSVLFTTILYTIVHFINAILNNYFITNNIRNYLNQIVEVNYMYTIKPEGIPILTNLWEIIPYPYFYLLPLILATTLLYLILNIKNLRKNDK